MDTYEVLIPILIGGGMASLRSSIKKVDEKLQ